MQLGAGRPEITISGPAHTDMPIWIQVSMPFGLGNIAYPIYIHPATAYCYDIEVRRGGELMKLLPNAEKRATMPGVYSGGPCGVIGLPGERKHQGRFPLHLLYRFDQPGSYEVRITRVSDFFHSEKTLAVSEWTPFEVLAAPQDRRTEWLAEMSRDAPSDVVALLEDWLPSVLGVPDEESLELIVPYLYHPESLVRRFTANGLRYWPEAEQETVAMRLLRTRGPTDVICESLRDSSDAAVVAALPYLHSDSPVLLSGAIAMIRNLALIPKARVLAETRSRAETAVVDAAEHVRRITDSQTRNDFASTLGLAHTTPAKQTLWRWIDAGVGLGQAVYAVTWYQDPSDLPRLAKLLESPAAGEMTSGLFGLPNALRRYDDAAFPYLEHAMNNAPAVSIRTECARELVLAKRPSAFAFVADAIENNREYKEKMVRLLKEQYVELRTATETELLSFARERSHTR